MDWLGFSFSSGDLWHIFSISSTNRLSFFKLYFCSCKSAVRLENQRCYNSFKFTGGFFVSYLEATLKCTVVATVPSDRGLRESQEKNGRSMKIISYSSSIYCKHWAKSSKGASVHRTEMAGAMALWLFYYPWYFCCCFLPSSFFPAFVLCEGTIAWITCVQVHRLRNSRSITLCSALSPPHWSQRWALAIWF